MNNNNGNNGSGRGGRYDESARHDREYGRNGEYGRRNEYYSRSYDGRDNANDRRNRYDDSSYGYGSGDSYGDRSGLQTNRASDGERFNVHISDEDFRREMSREPKYPRRYDSPVRERASVREQPPMRERISRSAPVRQSRPDKKNGCLFSVIYAVFVLMASAVLSFFLVIGINDMFALVKEDVNVEIDIPQNSDLSAVTKILDENEVINQPFFFKLYSRFSNKKSFSHGHYTLSSKSDYDMIIRKLTRPPDVNTSNNTITVVIPEGKNLMQIAEILEDKCVCSAEDFFRVLETHEWKHGFYQAIPKADNETTRKEQADAQARGESYKPINQDRLYAMEGYLFPAKYDFYIDENPLYAINRMLNGFNDRVINNRDLDFAGRTAALNEKYGAAIGKTIDMDFIITMASIIEREAREPEDMKNVASVFYNRLRNPGVDGIGGKLQSDATLWYPYATKEVMLESSLSKKEKESFVSVYSTLGRTGLPPGPICCPGLNSINAALSPNDTGYYYFFSDSAGVFHFSKNIEEHNSLRSQYGV